jgi:phosphatidate phosphatase APP1
MARVPDASSISTVRIVDPEAPFLVISDFDDTLAVSRVTSPPGLVQSAFLQDGDTQPKVDGMDGFYRCLVEDRTPTPALAVVSGTPHQYAPRMARFLAKNGFPLAGLYLRDLGPKTLSNYKQPMIRGILANLPQKAVLVGDSGEHDPEVYAQIRQEFPDRVLAVYIRDVGNSSRPDRFKGAVLFRDAKEAARDAVEKGLITQGCFSREFGAAKGEGT